MAIVDFAFFKMAFFAWTNFFSHLILCVNFEFENCLLIILLNGQKVKIFQFVLMNESFIHIIT